MDKDFQELRRLAMRSDDRELRALVGLDDAESEQEVLCDPEATDALTSEYAATLQRQRAFWTGVANRNRQGSQFAAGTDRYPSPTAVGGNSALDTNGLKARPYSMFKRF